jgi:hypothetical protein
MMRVGSLAGRAPDLPFAWRAGRATPGTRPDRGFGWIALAVWLSQQGRYDEAAAVRVFWPKLSARVRAGDSVHMTLRDVARHADWWGRRARQVDHEARQALSPPTHPTRSTAASTNR